MHGIGAAREKTRAGRHVHAFPFQHMEAKGFELRRMLVDDSSSSHKTKAHVLRVKGPRGVNGLEVFPSSEVG